MSLIKTYIDDASDSELQGENVAPSNKAVIVEHTFDNGVSCHVHMVVTLKKNGQPIEDQALGLSSLRDAFINGTITAE